ncbi:MAG TPA: ornithine carbamoyltransferase, partial [Methanomicrobiales archaeon]|nr:ornithine carbamoyltransferase [Methanomicrobiales archaeon]
MVENGAVARSILSVADLKRDELLALLDKTRRYKASIRKHKALHVLENRVIGLLFEKPSTRTRTSFETAVLRLGGEAIYLPTANLQMSRGEPVPDTARVLGSYLDVLIARVYAEKTLEDFASYAGIPVINALSDQEHPTQIISDLFTIQEAKGKFENLKLAFIGDGNNVCNSLLFGSALLGMDMTVASPEG